MKNLYLLVCVCSIIFCACSMGNNMREQLSDNSNGSTGAAMSVSGSAVQKKETEPAKIVIDETGKQQELKLGNINTANRATPFYYIGTLATDYAQVADGHYYFLRSDGNGNYTIYQDKGEIVGEFSVESGYVSHFTRYENRFYVLMAEEEEPWVYKFGYIDMESNKAVVLYDLTDKYPTMFYFFNQYLYFDDCSKLSILDRFSVDENNKNGQLMKISLKDNKKGLSAIPIKSKIEQKKIQNSFYLDSKFYYTKHEDNKVCVYSIDAHNYDEEKVFEYQYKESSDNIRFDITDDIIYCDDFVIPRNGGKMIRALKKAGTLKFTTDLVSCSYNSRYIYYIDKKYHLRRIDKKTMEDIKISNIKSMEVSCTEDSVYVKGYVKEILLEYLDETEGCAKYYENPISNDLYCMDLDGKNIKKIWNGDTRN